MNSDDSSSDYDDEELRAFLTEELPTERLAEIEAAVRGDLSLRNRLTDLIEESDRGVHSIGAIWRENRLGCPSRSLLGGYLLGVLDAGLTATIRSHLERVGCRYCRANLDDLETALTPKLASDQSVAHRRRYFETSVGHLRGK